MADFAEIIELSDDKLESLHKNLHGDISNSAIVEAHHLVTTELSRRGIDHGHIDDEWAIAQIEVDSVQSVDLENITTELSDELAIEVAKTIGISGDVKVMLTISGYELQIEKSAFEDEDLEFDVTAGDVEKTIKRRNNKFVVFSADGSREFGTYETKREAEERLEQIESFGNMDKAEGNNPPAAVREAAQRALDWIRDGKSGQGFTSVGRARARQLAAGQSVALSTVKRMKSFFARHIVDKKAEGFSRGEQGYPSPGKVAWDAWGGDAGRAWAESILDRVEKDKLYDTSGLEDNLNQRQKVLYTTIENIVAEFGAFNSGMGADGARYLDSENNPFSQDGINCANCVFYENGACEILNVEVSARGVCKFSIIPEKVVVAKHGTHDQSTHGSWAGGRVSPEVASKILQFTREWGGLSISMVDGSMPTTGYMVSKPPEFGKVVDETDFFDSVKGPKILSEYMREQKRDLATGKNYLGTWVNEGKVFLDVSENIKSEIKATRLGRERDQKKIWDVTNQVEIDTGGTGGIKKESQNGGVEESGEYDRRGNRHLRAGDLEEVYRERPQTTNEVEKHGTHDQSSHGNWAGTRQVAASITEKQVDEFKGGSAEVHLVSDGKGGLRFSDERQALHNAIVEESLRGIPVSTNPTYYMMGGGPTAGKSTMIERDDVNVPGGSKAVQVNPDNIKLKLPEYNQKSVEERAPYTHEESSHIAKRIQNEAMAKGLDVVLDSTGDSSFKKANAKIDKAREAGYQVVGFYATISISEALKRNEERAIKTGRKVPPAVVREIHASVSKVFPELAPKFDSVKLFDTTSDVKLIAEGTRGTQISILDQSLYADFLAKGGE